MNACTTVLCRAYARCQLPTTERTGSHWLCGRLQKLNRNPQGIQNSQKTNEQPCSKGIQNGTPHRDTVGGTGGVYRGGSEQPPPKLPFVARMHLMYPIICLQRMYHMYVATICVSPLPFTDWSSFTRRQFLHRRPITSLRVLYSKTTPPLPRAGEAPKQSKHRLLTVGTQNANAPLLSIKSGMMMSRNYTITSTDRLLRARGCQHHDGQKECHHRRVSFQGSAKRRRGETKSSPTSLPKTKIAYLKVGSFPTPAQMPRPLQRAQKCIKRLP